MRKRSDPAVDRTLILAGDDRFVPRRLHLIPMQDREDEQGFNLRYALATLVLATGYAMQSSRQSRIVGQSRRRDTAAHSMIRSVNGGTDKRLLWDDKTQTNPSSLADDKDAVYVNLGTGHVGVARGP
ncbi:hypothetical protein FHL15_005116 [Xylaria flabelliformis]|uniref:Uncharacterized protein n=1 Tax=Xylaria flabelliformis TaxID=2512241 RepID=A0A553I1G2_9PEZI|nr:hypothetical protein FHL15_005116 [Xylaria flabelliformis]